LLPELRRVTKLARDVALTRRRACRKVGTAGEQGAFKVFQCGAKMIGGVRNKWRSCHVTETCW
jgi:hypothetical protein